MPPDNKDLQSTGHYFVFLFSTLFQMFEVQLVITKIMIIGTSTYLIFLYVIIFHRYVDWLSPKQFSS